MSEESFDPIACLQAVRQGDQDAARVLVERLYPLVLRIVRRHLPRQTAEEDMAQEIFIKMFERLSQYEARDGIPFEHWLSRLAMRTCLDQMRMESRRPEVRWSDLTDDQTAWLEFMLLDGGEPAHGAGASAREIVNLLLAQLLPNDRLVIHLLDLEQKSVKEISLETGWSVVGVKVRAFRARRRLRKLAQQLKEEKQHEKF